MWATRFRILVSRFFHPRPDRCHSDLGVGNVQELSHDEGPRPHHRRGQLTGGRRNRLDRAGKGRRVAQPLHCGDRNRPRRHHIGHRRSGHRPEHRRGQRADLRRAAEGAPGDPCRHLHEHVGRPGGQKQCPQKHIDRDDPSAHIRKIAENTGGRAVEGFDRRAGRNARRAPAPVDQIVPEVIIENGNQCQQGQEPPDHPPGRFERQQDPAALSSGPYCTMMSEKRSRLRIT